MDNIYQEHWIEKKRLRSEDNTPLTPIKRLMQKMGIPDELGITYSTPVSPGALIQAVLDDAQITQSELAQQMGVTRTAIHLWIHGQRALTPENALSIQHHLGIPAHILLRLQADYQLSLTIRHNLPIDPVPRHSTL